MATPSALLAYHPTSADPRDRPHAQVENWACRSGDLSPVEVKGGCGAGETWCLMSDSKDYRVDHPLPAPLVPASFSSSTSLLMQDMAIDHSLPNSVLFNNDDRISSLERSVCSNFVCCGENLVDFHALIDHFEENHISIVSSTGKKLYPKSTPKPKLAIHTSRSSMSPTPDLDSTASTPSSSRSSSVVPSPPMPVTPLAPSSPSMSHDRASPPPPIAPHLPPAQSHLVFPTIEYNPYIGIIAPIADSSSSFVSAPTPKPKVPTPVQVEVISAFGPEYDFARDYARYEEAWRRKTTREAEEAAAFEHAQLERELREAEEEEMERMGYSLSLSGEAELDSLGLEGMSVIGEQATSRVRSSSQPPATNHGGKVPKTARPRPRVNTFLPRTSSCPTSSASPSTPSSSSSTGGPSRPKVTVPTIPNAPPVSLGKKREKAYKCPQPGCTKAYLNPNGLKYHLEKGTCKFDQSLAFRGGFVRAAVPPAQSVAPTMMSVVSPGPMEIEEDPEEEGARLHKPTLEVISNGTSYPAPSVAGGNAWIMPCAM